jgi:hypothetical protein
MSAKLSTRSSRLRKGNGGLLGTILFVLGAIFIILMIAAPLIGAIVLGTFIYLWVLDHRARKKRLQKNSIHAVNSPGNNASNGQNP